MTRTLALVPAVLLLAGCGTAPNSSEGSEPTKNDVSTSRVEFIYTGTDMLPEASLSAVGVIDYANNEGDLVIKSKGDAPGEMHAMFIGRDTFLGADIDGKMRWEAESRVERPTDAERFLPGPGGTKPDAVRAALEAASTKVERLGEEKVRDVQATHYRAHLKRTKPEEGVNPRPEQAVVDAWIDGNGMARRIRVSDETVEFYDFGVRADIEAPPGDQVVSEEEFEKLMSKGCRTKKADESAPVWCFFFGSIESSDATGYGPTETMPLRVTDRK